MFSVLWSSYNIKNTDCCREGCQLRQAIQTTQAVHLPSLVNSLLGGGGGGGGGLILVKLVEMTTCLE